MKKYLTEDQRVWAVEDFLSDEELISFDKHISSTEWVTKEGWTNPLWFNNISIFPDFQFVIDRVNKITDNEYSWISMGVIMRIQVGSEMNPHVDNYNFSEGEGRGQFMSATLYLNDNFKGGELYYTNLGISYTPKKGSIVFHPGFEELYKHGVSEVKENDRYAVGLIGKA